MALARRIAPKPAPVAVVAGGSVNFGGDGFFTGALGLPEGNYAVSWRTEMFQPRKADGTASKTPAFLAVIATFYPIDPQTGEAIGEPTEHPFNCGSNSHESFMPSADGRGFDAVPNGKSAGMWQLSNFGLLFDSLKNAGLPPGLVTSSLEPIEGVWVHTQNIPEPDEKKAAGQRARAKGRTGAAAMMGGQQVEDEQRDRVCTIVTEILEGGRPWDGSGGIPANVEAPTPQVAPKAAPRAAVGPRPVATRQAPAPVAAAIEVIDEQVVADAALQAISTVLGVKPNPTKLVLRTDAFAAVQKAHGDEMAQLVMENFLQSDEMLAAVLAELQYEIQGIKVGPAK